ncbi:MAG TPA: histidine kinase [Bacteroidales bacterium]|nr:histidine kinase [Bacteroidales bacterium]
MPAAKLMSNQEIKTVLSEFNRSLTLIADKSLLINNLTSRIKQLVPVERVFVFLFSEGSGCYIPEEATQPEPVDSQPITFNAHGKLFNWLSVNELPLLISIQHDVLEYLDPHEQRKLMQMESDLIYPLKVMNQISGAVFLGKRTDGLTYDKDDLATLSLLFNQAAFAIEHAILYEQQKERITKMYRADRLAVLGELAAGAAHEIRNPLTAIRSTIQYLARDIKDPEKGEMMAEVITEVDRINKIVQGLLSFARTSDLNATLINIEEFIMQLVSLLSSTLQTMHIETEFRFLASNPTINADREQLRQILLNVFMNSIDAMKKPDPSKSRLLTIKTENTLAKNNSVPMLALIIQDTGCGIPDENIEMIFNPFYTTKSEGTGLGLAICYGFVRGHNGEIEVQSEPGVGTSLTIKLPQNTIGKNQQHEIQNSYSRR